MWITDLLAVAVVVMESPWGVMMGSRKPRGPVGAVGFLSTYVGPQRSHPETGKQAACSLHLLVLRLPLGERDTQRGR